MLSYSPHQIIHFLTVMSYSLYQVIHFLTVMSYLSSLLIVQSLLLFQFALHR